ncbi:AsnC family transcriptional regulator [Heyndrickxia shackletonii]|uniref:AsnC family transcriptional regulator n=1 Tax=Heyndrickxia shackletonii TaxID=157838 RepID=A0A0Q3WQ22_9BACI|nr:AsnC family transcriptional regulator [Heyndrickxia shackletonii]KQL52911.1 AsnC family transcriptional regulator [Heyndrickxia shackletonii]NEY98909.1 AsnC family transcriptional regulator [Heyndrickxia shackletonii]
MSVEIDDLDRGIIKELSVDGRMSFKEIAGRLNVTEKTIRLRYKSLIEKEIFEVVGVVNPIALGLKSGAIIQIKVKPDSIPSVIEELKKIKVIRYITLTSGDYPLLVQIAVSDQQEITNIVLKLNQIQDITETNSIVQLGVYKNTFEYI